MTHNRINALLDLNAVDATGETGMHNLLRPLYMKLNYFLFSEKWEKARKLAEAISTRGIRNIWV